MSSQSVALPTEPTIQEVFEDSQTGISMGAAVESDKTLVLEGPSVGDGDISWNEAKAQETTVLRSDCREGSCCPSLGEGATGRTVSLARETANLGVQPQGRLGSRDGGSAPAYQLVALGPKQFVLLRNKAGCTRAEQKAGDCGFPSASRGKDTGWSGQNVGSTAANRELRQLSTRA